MHRAFRRAWWALAAAVGLGLVFSTRTLSAPPVEQSSERGAPNPDAQAAHALAAEAARATEVEVELAWLADPVTFPYHLAARIDGGALHARGFVHNKAAHDRVLQVAHAHCPLEVIDELRIHPSMVMPGMSAALAQPAVEAALHEAFPEQADAIKVTCRPDGQVSVSGTVPSLQVKLAASQRLRQLPGCAAVVNQLQIGAAPALAAGQHPNQESQGSLETTGVVSIEESVVPAAHWQPESNDRLPSDSSPLPERLVPIAAGSTPAPGDISTSLASPPAVTPNAPLLARLTARVESVCAGAAEVCLVPQGRRNLLVQLKVPDDAEGARLAEMILALPELAVYQVEVKLAEPPASSTTPTGPPSAAQPREAAIVTQDQAAPIPLLPVPEVPTVDPLPAVPPGVPGPVVQTSHQSAAPVASKTAPADGLIYIEPDFRKAQPQKPQPPAPPSPAQVQPQKPQPAAPPSPAHLQARVESICGKAASDVHLVVRSPADVLVQFTAHNEKEGEQLAGKVMAMPELSAYHVDLDVKVTDPAPTVARPVAAPPTIHNGTPAVITQAPAKAKPQVFNLPDPPAPPPAVSPMVWHAMPSSPTPSAPASSPMPPVIAMTTAPPTPVVQPAPTAIGNEPTPVVSGIVPASAPAPRPPVVPASPPTKLPGDKQTAPGGYESTGVAVVSEPAAVPPPMMAPAQLQQRVEIVCGSRAEVSVLARSATNVLVKFKARDAAEAERLTNSILNLPELRPYQVDVDVKLAQ